jgi:hypothetical protein
MKLFGENLLKGKVGFDTSETGGTTFWITLPAEGTRALNGYPRRMEPALDCSSLAKAFAGRPAVERLG